MTCIVNGEATASQIGAFIAGLRLVGETSEVIAGCAEVMRANAIPIRCSDPYAVDIVGTGGDGAHTFNISTAAAFVAAGAGATVAKHGSYGVSSKCGSANVLSELGVNLGCPPETIEQCLNEIGVAFLFAPMLHPAMKHVAGPRRELGVWSIFNILGPLCNPAQTRRGVIGVFKPELLPIVADACIRLEARRQYIVHGDDGLDEFTTTKTTQVIEVCGGKVKRWMLHPDDLGLKLADPVGLTGGEPAENAAIIRSVIEGQPGPKRDIVLLNAAFALVAAQKASTPEKGVRLAGESIDSGAAREKLHALAAASHVKSS